MFRKLVLSTTVALACGSAYAADLPRRAAAVYAPTPVFTWAGFYAGLNAGGNWGDSCKSTGLASFDSAVTPRVYTPITAFSGGCSNTTNNGRFIGGGQIGYNMQFGQIVGGVEADIDYLSRNRSSTNYTYGTPAQIAGGGGTTVPFGVYAFSGSGNSDYVGTVRARLGYAMDRTLLYVTGGLAYGNRAGNGSVAYYNGTTITATPTAVYSRSGSGSGVGFALGAGIEQAISNNWSVKLEYLHTDLGRRSGGYSTSLQPAFTTTNYTLNSSSSRITNDSVRIGVNYRFN